MINPWIIDIAALNAIVDAGRRYLLQPDKLGKLALQQSIERAENGMTWNKENVNETRD